MDEDEQPEVAVEEGRKKRLMRKNPFVETSFLPDKERELQEELERKKLQEEWEQEQNRIKSNLEIWFAEWLCNSCAQMKT